MKLTWTKFRKFARKSLSLFLAFQLATFQLTSLVVPSLIHAQVDQSLAVSYQTAENELRLSSAADGDYALYYQADQLEAVRGSLGGDEAVYLGTCSTDSCVADQTQRLILKTEIDGQLQVYRYELVSGSLNQLDQYQGLSLDLDGDEISWLEQSTAAVDGVYVDQVELYHVYSYPGDDRVSVTFTSLPEQPGNLTIQQVTLSDEQVEELGALSNVAYEITSSMEDGSFTYDLTLPNPNSSEDVRVKYSEDGESFNSLSTPERVDSRLLIRNLNHFTLFIITDDEAGYTGPWTDYPTQGFFADGVHFPTTIAAGETATWTFSSITPGKYTVFASWSLHANRTTAAPYTLNHLAGAYADTVNQELMADGSTGPDAGWSGWYLLGTFDLDTSSNLVLSSVDNTSGMDYVIADEVLLVSTEEIWVDDDWAGSAVGDDLGSDRIFGANAFDNISDAVDQVSENGTVYVKEGDYPEDVLIEKSLTLEGEESAFGSSRAKIVGRVDIESDGVLFKKMMVEGGGPSGSGETEGIFVGKSSGFVDDLAEKIEIRESNITSISGTGSIEGIHVKSYGGAYIDGLRIVNNKIENVITSTGGGSGIKLQADLRDIRVENNIFSGIEGIWAYGVTSTPSSGEPGNPQDLEVTGNAFLSVIGITYPAAAFGIDETSGGADDGNAANVMVERNNLSGAPIGIINKDTSETLSARYNWWGDASGPSGIHSGSGVLGYGDIDFCPFLTNNDLQGSSYGGDCLNQITGRTFVDLADNGLRLIADGDHPDGRMSGFTVRLYDASWSELEEQTTSTTGQVGQFKFDNLLADNDTYYVCGVDRAGYVHSPASIGQAAVKPDGSNAAPAYADAEVVANSSGASDESSVCWEVLLDSNDGGYINPGYVEFEAPTLISPADPFYTPGVAFSQTWGGVTGAVEYGYESCNVDPGDDGVAPCTSSKYTNTYSGTTKNVGAGQPNSHFWWRVRAIDGNGNFSDWSESRELIIDNDEPVTSWDTLASEYTADSTPTLTGTSTDVYDAGIALVEYRIERASDSAVIENWTPATPTDGAFDNEPSEDFSVTPSSLADNEYTFYARATDAAGNIESTATLNLTVDTTDPVSELTAPSDGDVLGGTIDIEGIITDTNLWRYYFVIKNALGSVVDGLGTVYDNGPIVNLLFSWDSTGFADGLYTAWLAARDKANNRDDAVSLDTVDFTVDNTAPTTPAWITILDHENTDLGCGGATNNRSITVDWADTTDANFSHYVYEVLTSTWTTTVTTSQRSGLVSDADGDYGYRVKAVDEAGNESGYTEWCELTLDRVEPESTITDPVEATGAGNVVFLNDWDGVVGGTASDSASPIARVWLSIERASDGLFWDGDSWETGTEATTRFEASGTDTWTYDFLAALISAGEDDGGDIPEDSYTVTSHAEDTAGNVESTTELEIIVDRTIPEIALTIDPTNPDGDNGWYKTEPTITLTATDDQSPDGFEQIEYQWNGTGGTWTTTTSTTISFKPPGQGINVLYYRAKDKAGNYSDTGVKTVRYDADGLEEGPLNVSVSPNPTSGSTATVSWKAAKDDILISKYEVIWSLDGTSTQYSKSVSSSTFETEIDNLVEGTWTIKVKAFDGVGNSKEAGTTLVVDRTAPDAPVLTLDGTGPGTASLSWTAIADASEYLLFYGVTSGDYIYGANVGNTTNFTVQGLGAGDYFFIVRAKDAAGNQSPNSNEVSTGTIAGAPGVAPGTPAEGFQPAGDVQGATTEENLEETGGEVLGLTDVGWWQYNLPWIILILQALLILLIDAITRREQSFAKHLLALIVTGVAIGLFMWLVDPQVYPAGSFHAILAQWFIAFSIGVTLMIQLFNYAFIEEVTS